MRLTHKLSLAVGILSVVAASGCGSGGSAVIPSTKGNYSNATLKGSYVYQIHGSEFVTPQIEPYRQYGVITADGAGNITAQSDDATLNAGGNSFACNSSCGTYQIASDGTGFITLTNSAFSSAFSPALGPVTLAVTLSSSSNIYLMEADFFASGAGLAEAQDSTVIAAAPSGTFVFRVHQTSSAQNSAPASQVGVVTLPGSGVNSSLDQNLNGASTSPTATWTLGAPGALGRGTGSFTDSASFTTNFNYYIVNSGKFAVLVTNSGAVGSGSAEAQTGAVSGGLSGSYAFGSRGDDSTNLFDGLATVGQITAGSGTISGVADAMQDGNYSNGNLSGSYTTAASGRVAVSLNSGATQLVFWMVSPSRAFFMNSNSSQVEDGTADLQTVNSFSKSTLNGQFAMAMDGLDLTQLSFTGALGTLARVGALQFDGSGKLALTELANDSLSGNGAQSPGGMTGTYTVGANGRATGTLSNSNGGLDLVMYAISGSDAYALQVDGGTNTSGPIELQH